MIKHSKLVQLNKTELESLLTKNKIYIPRQLPFETLIDYCTSRLHGIEFIHNDEEIINSKITHIKPKPKPVVPGEKCPACSNNAVKPFRVPKGTNYFNWTQCNFCGEIFPPKETKVVPGAKA